MKKETNSHEDLEKAAVEQKLSELQILSQSLAETKERELKLYDQILRLGAEFDNFRKRSEARIADARRSGQEDVLLAVVGLCDVMDQAETSMDKATDVENLKQGLKLLKQQFDKFLSERGVAPINAVGKPLDPHMHEAVIQEENGELEEGIVTSEVQKGYTFKDRVLRPAKVKVSVRPKV